MFVNLCWCRLNSASDDSYDSIAHASIIQDQPLVTIYFEATGRSRSDAKSISIYLTSILYIHKSASFSNGVHALLESFKGFLLIWFWNIVIGIVASCIVDKQEK
jgi:hypothetical protein